MRDRFLPFSPRLAYAAWCAVTTVLEAGDAYAGKANNKDME